LSKKPPVGQACQIIVLGGILDLAKASLPPQSPSGVKARGSIRHPPSHPILPKGMFRRHNPRSGLADISIRQDYSEFGKPVSLALNSFFEILLRPHAIAAMYGIDPLRGRDFPFRRIGNVKPVHLQIPEHLQTDLGSPPRAN
jgi:hypothetical protein